MTQLEMNQDNLIYTVLTKINNWYFLEQAKY